MDVASRAIETTGIVDTYRHLLLDETLPISVPRKVRVIILFPEDDDFSETEWLQAASGNPAFDFLKDSEEDIYSEHEGKPFYYKKKRLLINIMQSSGNGKSPMQ